MTEGGDETNQGSGSAQVPPVDEMTRQAASFVEGRTREYGNLWLDGVERLSKGDYKSSDLISDWFTVWGKGLRDLQRTARPWWTAAAEAATGQGAAPPSGSLTIYTDCEVDFSSEFKTKVRQLSFHCSDLVYRRDRALAVPASEVMLEVHIDPMTGVGRVRVSINAAGMVAGSLVGRLYESAKPDTPISDIDLYVPPGYSRY